MDKLNETKERLSLGFPLASDPDLAASRRLGIVFGKEGGRKLPVPAVFLVGTDGKILFSFVHPDYSVRLDPDILIAAARAAGESN